MSETAVPKVTITGIEISQHRLKFDPPFHASWDSKPRRHWDATIVRVHTDAGITGIGSGDLMLGFLGHEHLFIGQDALATERHWRVLNNISFHYGRCWPLDIALWDLAGKIANQPCWKLLGGLSDRVRAYASSGTLRDPEALAEAALAYRERGVAALKIRFHRGDREGMRRLRDMTDIRIAGGEMTRELYEFRDLIAEGALDVLQPDVALVGLLGVHVVAAL